tara:strand:+ start:163 stop:309 length:147 start_codon:yes stop_codon:yes gene_type:complete
MDGGGTSEVDVIGSSIIGSLAAGSSSEVIGCCAEHAVSIKNTLAKMTV